MKRITTILIACMISLPAMAAKPLHGRYTCKGTVTHQVNIGIFNGGEVSSPAKGKLLASRGSFTAFINSGGLKSVFSGYLEPDMQKVTWSSSNRGYKGIERDCYVGLMWQTGSGFQNKKGRFVNLSLEQSYYCGLSDAENVDRYRLTCRR